MTLGTLTGDPARVTSIPPTNNATPRLGTLTTETGPLPSAALPVTSVPTNTPACWPPRAPWRC